MDFVREWLLLAERMSFGQGERRVVNGLQCLSKRSKVSLSCAIHEIAVC